MSSEFWILTVVWRVRSYAGLWPRVTSFENLWLAFPRDRPGKRGRAVVAAFEFDLEPNLLAIADPAVSAVTRLEE